MSDDGRTLIFEDFERGYPTIYKNVPALAVAMGGKYLSDVLATMTPEPVEQPSDQAKGAKILDAYLAAKADQAK